MLGICFFSEIFPSQWSAQKKFLNLRRDYCSFMDLYELHHLLRGHFEQAETNGHDVFGRKSSTKDTVNQ